MRGSFGGLRGSLGKFERDKSGVGEPEVLSGQTPRDTKNAEMARRTAQAVALRPSTDKGELEALLALGRKAVELNKGEWELLALGMAEYRNGHFAAADEALLSALKASQDLNASGIAAFYRAMSLFQQGKQDEARDLATKAAAEMKPLPRNEKNPLLDGATSENLILWIAYNEAKALIGLDAPPAVQPKPEGK
jgi:tetratricopeptide (TPR) repeat protein